MDIDILIIGQGLAGSLLAWELMQRDCKVHIIDNGQENASQVAAGLINPVTGMRFVKSADMDFLLPTAKACYEKLADFFQEDFYHEKPMLRIFRSIAELNFCNKRFNQSGYEIYLDGVTEQNKRIKNLVTPFGFLEQKQTGYLATRPLLSCLKDFFIARNCYQCCSFDYWDIQPTPLLQWQDITAKQIIFCEGHQTQKNPWFSWLPLQPVKGEILTMQHTTDLPDKILNFGNWLIPLNESNIRIGASFDHDNLNTEPTMQAREALLNSLKELAPAVQATLINQQAGIRPCTQDRQPFIGKHPHYQQIAIFNGFGAKGSLQIPWYAQHFADVLLKGTTLRNTCNIVRYETCFAG
jgi:glycine/D-amino acid oxidase-like deaminating enzyme